MNLVDFNLENQWNGGFQGSISIENNSQNVLDDWTLEFEAPFEISQIWNAEIVSRNGNRYVVRYLDWNQDIAPGGTASFGFTANGQAGGGPSRFSLNGVDIDASDTPTTPAPPVTSSDPQISIGDVTVSEGDDAAVFRVELSEASSERVTVQYATRNNTATTAGDLIRTNGNLVFNPGQTSRLVRVNLLDDNVSESTEDFSLRLKRPSNATLADTFGVATILDDDAPVSDPQISIGDVTVSEGDDAAVFRVELSEASSEQVTVQYATRNNTATTAGDLIRTNGTLVFNAGQTSRLVRVNLLDDNVSESTENFSLRLTRPSNATLADTFGVAIILDDDATAPPPPPPQSGDINYGEALQKSFLFYEAQRSGPLPRDNRIAWRGDSTLQDGSDVGRDLTGGYFDAGDHVKFGFPMAGAMTVLGWGVNEYRGAYQQSGQLDEVLDAIKWGTDYILKAHDSGPNGTRAFYGQVGDGGSDHAYWGAPESLPTPRTSFKIDAQNPGSDLAGEAAAALAVASTIFRPTDAAYANELLTNAEQLFEFADTFRGKYSDSIPDASNFYNSFSGFNDELVWSATWLYKATGNQTYLDKAESYYQGLNRTGSFDWDDKSAGAAVLLAQETGKAEYRNDVEALLDYWSDDSGAGITYTDGGLAWHTNYGSLRHSSNVAFLAGVYSDTVNDKGDRYDQFSKDQIDYVLGDNPNDFSYQVGFGDDFARNPHHRGASGTNDVNDPRPNEHTLYGALVGGPTSPSDNGYQDVRSDFIANEVALDYNAGFTGAVARLYDDFGGEPLSDAALDNLVGIDIPSI